MEVPDLLVVTKADLGDVALRARRDLAAALRSLGSRDTKVLAVASLPPPEGIDELADALDEHRDATRRRRAPPARAPAGRARRVHRRARRARAARAGRPPRGRALPARAGRRAGRAAAGGAAGAASLQSVARRDVGLFDRQIRGREGQNRALVAVLFAGSHRDDDRIVAQLIVRLGRAPRWRPGRRTPAVRCTRRPPTRGSCLPPCRNMVGGRVRQPVLHLELDPWLRPHAAVRRTTRRRPPAAPAWRGGAARSAPRAASATVRQRAPARQPYGRDDDDEVVRDDAEADDQHAGDRERYPLSAHVADRSS